MSTAILFFAAALACIILMGVARHHRRQDNAEADRRRIMEQHFAEQFRRPK